MSGRPDDPSDRPQGTNHGSKAGAIGAGPSGEGADARRDAADEARPGSPGDGPGPAPGEPAPPGGRTGGLPDPASAPPDPAAEPLEAGPIAQSVRAIRGEHEPVFEEPWQATAFALAVHLRTRDTFTSAEWTRTLGQVIHGPDADRPYYEQWLKTLERLCAEHGLASSDEIATRAEAWRQAYRRTPHGQPVTLDD